MNLLLARTQDDIHAAPIFFRGFVEVPQTGEIIGTSDGSPESFFFETDINGEYTLLSASDYSLIQTEQRNSKPILFPWYRGSLGGGGVCLVNDLPNSVPHYDIPFLAYTPSIRNSYHGIVLRPVGNLNTIAYISNYSYEGNTLGATSIFKFSREINIAAGEYLIGYSGYDGVSSTYITNPSGTLYTFLVNALMLYNIVSAGLYFNDIPIELHVNSDNYINVIVSENVTGNKLTIKMTFE